jgi:hypothetical protein
MKAALGVAFDQGAAAVAASRAPRPSLDVLV